MVITVQDEGLDVVTEDGSVIGRVKDVSGSYFKVDAPMKRDFWLAGEHIRTRDTNCLTLDVSKAELGACARSEPGLEPEEDPMSGLISAGVIGEDELLQQRARMEAEVAEQSMRLPPHEPSITQERGPQPYEKIPPDHAAFRDHAGQYVQNYSLLHYQELQEAEAHTSRRRMMMRGAMVFGAIGLAAGAAYLMTRRSRRHNGPVSRLQEGAERGAQFVSGADFCVRDLRMVPRLLRDMATRAK